MPDRLYSYNIGWLSSIKWHLAFLSGKHLASSEQTLTRNLLINFLRWIFIQLFRLLTRTSVLGRENLPKEGAYIVASNHLSEIEVPLVYLILNRKDATALIADKHKQNPLFSWLVNLVGGIWINRVEADIDALRSCVITCAKEDCLRSPRRNAQPDRRHDPCKNRYGISGGRRLGPYCTCWSNWHLESDAEDFLIRDPGSQFGLETIHITQSGPRNRDADLLMNTDEIMCQIAAAPPSTGCVQQAPRLVELLANTQPDHEFPKAEEHIPLTEGSIQDNKPTIGSEQRRRRKVSQRSDRKRGALTATPARWKLVEVPFRAAGERPGGWPSSSGRISSVTRKPIARRAERFGWLLERVGRFGGQCGWYREFIPSLSRTGFCYFGGIEMDELKQIEQNALAELGAIQDQEALEKWRILHLRSELPINAGLRSLGTTPKDQRPAIGQQANHVKRLGNHPGGENRRAARSNCSAPCRLSAWM
jgi:hypothetical protein